MMQPRNARRFWIAFYVALLALPALTAWNLIVTPFAPRAKIRIGPKLVGVMQTLPVEWSFAALDNGTLQKAIASHVTDAIPIRPLLIRINNEIRRTLFGELTAPGILRGRGGQLIEDYYVKEFCARRLAQLDERLNAALPVLNDLKTYYESRGGLFVYVISPSKMDHMPDVFAHTVPCPVSASESRALVAQYIARVTQAGIPVIDTATPIHAQRGQNPTPLFPVGGVHWNALGFSQAVVQIVKAINAQAGRALVPVPSFMVTMSGKPSGQDTDLADLLNVMFPAMNEPTPQTHYTPGADCRQHLAKDIDAAIVGTSFMHSVASRLISDACLSRLTMYFYLVRGKFGGNPYRDEARDLVPTQLSALRDTKLMILEDNEAMLGLSKYPAALRDYLYDRAPAR